MDSSSVNVSSHSELMPILPELPNFCDKSSILDLRDFDKDSLSEYFYSRAESSIILGFYPVTFLFGVIANSLFLLVLFQNQDMRTVTNAYLGNLAVADLLVIFSVDYHFLGFYLFSPQVKTLGYTSSVGMGFNVTIQYMAHFTSIALVFTMTVERYLGICEPFYHRLIARKGRTFTLIAASWIFGALYSCALIAPRSFVLVKTCIIWPDAEAFQNLPNVLYSRQPIHMFYRNMPPILQLFPFSIVMTCNTVMYAHIIKKLHKRVARFTEEMRQIMLVRNQVARLLIANGSVFFLCYIPFYIFRFNEALLMLTQQNYGFKLKPTQIGAFDWVVVFLVSLNSIINPVIYSVTNERYRAAFARVFRSRRLCRKQEATSSIDNTQLHNISLSITNVTQMPSVSLELQAQETI